MMPLSPNAVPTPPPEPAGSSENAGPVLVRQPSGRWLERINLFLRVMIRLYVGLILCFLPWTHLWSLNRLFLYFDFVAHVLNSGAVRGMVSGLGLLNLWIGIWEAIHYREN